MSRTVDERVVQMQFDNKQFEREVQTSMSTLSRLKQSLDLRGASKGLENVSAAAKSCDLSGLTGAVDTVRVKFSALEIMAVTALANITNSAVNAGKRIVSALTIEPIRTGFQEYETQINAIQTILANTESKGSTLSDVNAALDELNHYADMTIYNFTEMTRNIGTFTAAGVDLDTSVSAIKGIANLAAVSGSTSQQASTAMYQLSQALAAGTVKLQDWNSVVNAGMGGQVFQDALKETARVHNVAIDDMIKKEGSFRETLSKGWLTTEILTETLSKFTGDLTESQLVQMGYTEEQVKSIIKMGQTANDAATKVKTLTQLWDTLKEAAQSGWTKTWQLIIGDFGEAKELFTGISDTVSEIINSSSDRRNNLLEEALLSNWGKLTKAINEAGVETQVFEDKVKDTAKAHGYDINRIIEQYGSLDNAFKKGAVSTLVLKDAINKLRNSTTDLSGVNRLLRNGDTGDDVKKVQELLQNLNFDIGKTGVDGIIGSNTQAAIKAFQEMKGLTIDGIIGPETLKALEEASTTTTELSDNIFGMVDAVTELGGREKIIESFKNVLQVINNIVKPVKDALSEVFPPTTSEQLVNAIDKIHVFTEKLKVSEETADKIKRTFKGLFSVVNLFKKGLSALITPIGNFIGSGGLNGIANALLNITASIGDFFTSLDNSIAVDSFFATISSGIFRLLKDIGSTIDPALAKVESFGDVWNYVKIIVCKAGKTIYNELSKVFDLIKNNDSVKTIISKISPSVQKLKDKFLSLLSTFESTDKSFNLENIQNGIKQFVKYIKDNKDDFSLSKILEKIPEIFEKIKSTASPVIEKIKALGGNLSDVKNIIKENLIIIIEKARKKIHEFSDTLGRVKVSICGTAEKIGNAIKDAFAWISDNKLLTKLAGIGIFAIIKKIISIINNIKGMFHKDSSLTDGISDVLHSVKKSLSAFTTSVRIASIVSIAAAITLLTVAMKNIASMETEQIKTSLIGIGVLLAELTVALTVLNKSGSGGFKNGAGILLMVIALSKVIKILGTLGTMDITVALQGLALMGSALAELGIVLTFISKMSEGKVLKSGAGILLTVVALGQIVKILGTLGSMDPTSALQGLARMGAALAELGIVIAFISKMSDGDELKSGATIFVVSYALINVAKVLKKIGNMSWEEIGKGLVGMGGALAEMVVALRVLKDMPESIIGAGSILIMTTGLKAIASSLKKIGNMSWEGITKGLVGMGGALAELAVIPGLLGNFSGFNGIIGDAAILLLVQGLGQIADALKQFGEMTFDEITNGLIGMGGSLVELGVVAGLLGNLGGLGSVIGSASLLLGIQGLGELANALKQFGEMSWDEITQGLVAMGGALGETALGGLLNTFSGLGALSIETMAKPLGDLADSVKNWTGVTVPENLGSQVGSLAGGIKKFNFTGWGADAIAALATPMGDLADSVSKWCGVSVPSDIKTGLSDLADGVKKFNFTGWGADAIADLATPFGDLGEAVAKWSGVVIPSDIQTGLSQLAGGIATWNCIDASNIPTVIKDVGDFVDEIVKWNNVSIPDSLGTNLKSFAEGVNDCAFIYTFDLGEVCDAIMTLRDTVNAISEVDFDGVSSRLNTFAASIGNMNVSTDSFSGIGSDIVSRIEGTITDSSDSMTGVGTTITSSIASGMESGLNTVTAAITTILQTMMSITEGEYGNFVSAGSYLIIGMASGMTSKISDVQSAGRLTSLSGAAVAREYYDIYANTGVYLVAGFVSGIRSNIYLAAQAVASMAAAASLAARKELQIHSPSKIFYQIGDYTGLGFVNALCDYKEASYEAGRSIATSAREGLTKAISKATDIVENGISGNPTIRPVLDLSAVESGAKQIRGIIGMSDSLSVSGNIVAINSMMRNRQNVTNNDDVVSAINGLSKHLGNVGNTSYNINGISYDDGSAVSEAVKTLVRATVMGRRA